MQQKKIIIFIIILFLASSIYLFARGDDYKAAPDWWALSFVDPKSNNLNFVIENFDNNTNFHYELLQDTNKLSEGDVQIKAGEKKELILKNSEISSQNNNKYTIRVSLKNETKEIYKNIKN